VKIGRKNTLIINTAAEGNTAAAVIKCAETQPENPGFCTFFMQKLIVLLTPVLLYFM